MTKTSAKYTAMNYLKTIICCFLLTGCGDNGQKKWGQFAKLHRGRDIILVSCFRCDCVVEELNLIYQQRPELLNDYDICIDSTCKTVLLPAIKTVHIPQASIDTLSTDVYNALIIKKRGSGYRFRLMETSEARQMPKLLAN